MIKIIYMLHGMIKGVSLGGYWTTHLMFSWQALILLPVIKKIHPSLPADSNLSSLVESGIAPASHDNYAKYILSSCMLFAAQVTSFLSIACLAFFIQSVSLAIVVSLPLILAYTFSFLAGGNMIKYSRQFLWDKKNCVRTIDKIDKTLCFISMMVLPVMMILMLVLIAINFPPLFLSHALLWTVIGVLTAGTIALISFSLIHPVLFIIFSSLKDHIRMLQRILNVIKGILAYLASILITTLYMVIIGIPLVCLSTFLNIIPSIIIGAYLGWNRAQDPFPQEAHAYSQHITWLPQIIARKIDSLFGRKNSYTGLIDFFYRQDFRKLNKAEFSPRICFYDDLLENCPPKATMTFPLLSQNQLASLSATNKANEDFILQYEEILTSYSSMAEGELSSEDRCISLLVSQKRDKLDIWHTPITNSAVKPYKKEHLKDWLRKETIYPNTQMPIKRTYNEQSYIENIDIKAEVSYKAALGNSVTIQNMLSFIHNCYPNLSTLSMPLPNRH